MQTPPPLLPPELRAELEKRIPPSPELVELRAELERIEAATGHPITRALELLDVASSTRLGLRAGLEATTAVLEEQAASLPADDDDDDAPVDLGAIARAFGAPGGVELEQRMSTLFDNAMRAMLAGDGKPLEPLQRIDVLEDGRRVRVVVAATEEAAKVFAPLGGIEGAAELMLVTMGATTETEGDPLMTDLAHALKNDEPVDITFRTVRQGMRFSMVSRSAAALVASSSSTPATSTSSTPATSTRPKVPIPIRDVPDSVPLPPMLRSRKAPR